MTTREILDLVLVGTQILTLIALIVYVVKTWQIASASKVSAGISALTLQEMKEARDQEAAPYIVVYFDMPQGEHVIYLVVRNIGRSIARNIKLELTPKLIGISRQDFAELPMIKNGIASLPPSHEIRTFIDSTVAFFGENNDKPLSYVAKVSFAGGLSETQRVSEQVLDLTAYKDLSWISRKGLHELTNEVEKISRSSERVSKELSELNYSLSQGIHLRNAVLTSAALRYDTLSWKHMVRSKLLEFKHLWSSLYAGNQEKLRQPFLAKWKNRLTLIADELLVMTASCPPGIQDATRDSLLTVIGKLADLDAIRFHLDVGQSASEFDAIGNEILQEVEHLIIKLQRRQKRAGA